VRRWRAASGFCLGAALASAALSGAAPATAGPSKRSPSRRPVRTQRVLSQAEIDAFLDGEGLRARAAQRRWEAQSGAAAEWSGRPREAGDLSPELLAGRMVPFGGPEGHVHRGVTRRPPGTPPPRAPGLLER